MQAADDLPDPTRIFSPKASLTLYLDAAGAGQTAFAKALEAKSASLSKSLNNLPGMTGLPAGLPTDMEGFASLKNAELAELAAVLEGDASGLGEGKLDSNASFALVARLSGKVDTQAFMAEVLGLLEKEQAGISNQVMSSRSTVGSAEVYKVPGEALGGAQMPFSVEFAIGPGSSGTVMAIGRAERVRDFLAAKTTGTPPPGLNALLPQRGQFWLYLTDIQGATKGLAGAAGQNPMAAGMAGELEKVKEVGFNLTFGATAMDLNVALGCADADTAKQMADGVQSFMGMMQMMASQNPQSVPPFLSKITSRARGNQFTVSTALTMKDMDMAFSNLGLSPTAGSTPTSVTVKPQPVVEALPEPPTASVDVEFHSLLPGENQDLRRGKITINNRGDKPVRDVRVTFEYLDASGRKLGEWTRRQQDPRGDTLVGPKTSRVLDCNLFKVPFRTESFRVQLHEVTYADGSTWTEPARR
jgi:hypothetical protein